MFIRDTFGMEFMNALMGLLASQGSPAMSQLAKVVKGAIGSAAAQG